MWTLTQNKDWESLRQYSWIRDMRGVPQSPVHHAEGDVETHTQMVLEKLVNLPEFAALNAQDQEIVWTAALLHDVEKRSTTFTDDKGEIVSPGHARKGAQTVRSMLYREIPAPFHIREQVVKLVRYHGLPLWLFEKPDPLKTLLKAALETDLNLLVMLAKADILGRICADSEEMLYRIDLFGEYYKEQGCEEINRLFSGDHARFLYFQREGRFPHDIPFDDTKADVYLMSGLPGSGKDWQVKTRYKDLPVISLDDKRRARKIAWNDEKENGRIIQEARENAREFLRKGQSFVWNATNITEQMRAQLIALCAPYNPRVHICYVEVPYRELLRQNANRDYPVPETALHRMMDKLEVPEQWEAHSLTQVIRE